MKKFIIPVLLLCLITNISAQSKELTFVGNLRIDSNSLNGVKKEEQKQNILLDADKKSPLLAGLLSAVVPGAGEFYAESYWKSAIFLVIEASAIAANIIYNKKGDDATNDFQNFADAHWDARRYAEWMNKFAEQLNIKTGQIDLTRVNNHDFSQLNQAESQVVLTDATGKELHFSHVLPSYHSQQYFELIGKYHQFNHGWDDSDPNALEWTNNLSPRFHEYAAMHIKPDDTFYKYASTAAVVIVINHIISAADAIWSTSRYNKNLTASLEMKRFDYIYATDFYPQLNLKIQL